jgi:hypothetical protein
MVNQLFLYVHFVMINWYLVKRVLSRFLPQNLFKTKIYNYEDIVVFWLQSILHIFLRYLFLYMKPIGK